MEKTALTLLLVVGALLSSCIEGHSEYYVITGDLESSSCPSHIPCHSLSYYFNNSGAYFKENSVFIFMKGKHVLNQDDSLLIDGVTNITLRGEESVLVEGFHQTVSQSTVLINCEQSPSGIVIHNSSMIRIIGLTFASCGGYLPVYIAQGLSSLNPLGRVAKENWFESTMALALVGTTDTVLYKVSIQNSTDIGLFSFNSLNITVSYSSFARNNLEGHSECRRNSCLGGNAVFIYAILHSCSDHFITYPTSIMHSNFTFGYDSGLYRLASGSGLSLYMEQSDYYGVDVKLDNLILYGNTGIGSVNFRYAVSINVPYYSLIMTKCVSVYGNQIHPVPKIPPSIRYGSGFSAFIGVPTNITAKCFSPAQTPVPPQVPILVANSSFSHNHASFGAGMIFRCNHLLSSSTQQYVVIDSCLIKNNSGFGGAGFFYTQLNGLNFNVIIRNVTVSGTRHYHPDNIGPENAESSVLIRRSINITLIDFTVQDNSMTGMLLLNSLIFFKGSNSFSNNSGENGGGLVLFGDSTMVLIAPVLLLFKNNHATDKGGAICVSTVPYTKPPCFLMPFDPTLNTKPDINVTFSGNTANIAGSVIYGGIVDKCYLTYVSGFSPNGNAGSMGGRAFEHITHYHNQTGSSLIASDPVEVCFCSEGMPNCSIAMLNFTLLPGQSANISMITVGHMGGISPGVIAIQEWSQTTDQLVHMAYESTETKCSNLQYRPNVNLHATYPTVHYLNLFLPHDNPQIRKVFFRIEECPLGFDVSPITHECDCNDRIKRDGNDVTCNAPTKTFSHSGNKWLGYLKKSRCFITSTDCHWNYCKRKTVNFTLETSDRQCDFNRAGLLCGQCSKGYSLMLGSNKCGQCTNSYLALIVVFALAGVVLIAFITALNLTVSTGTINGLIFYANIVKINELTFFSDPNQTAFKFFIWFTSWINLDFGIETCFFDGMASYTKVWLQFAFPFYLWFLVICIIFLSRHSYRMSKLMGRHSISVLATILLLSFTKILRTCILIWQLSYVQCESHTYNVWAVDPSLDYFGAKHMLMFFFALAVFLFLALPYTLLLLFSPLIEGYFSRYRCCRWWVKLKPFFDAYNGPYKDKYRFWTGLLLLVRLFMVVFFSFNTAGESLTVAIIVIFAGVMLCITTLCHGLYRSRINTILECFFILNLIFIASATLVNVFQTLSIAMSFFVFLGIVTRHVLVQIGLPKKIKRFYRKHIKKENISKEVTESLPVHVDLLDDRVISHDADSNITTTTFDLKDRLQTVYREGSVFVRMKRETLLRDSIL